MHVIAQYVFTTVIIYYRCKVILPSYPKTHFMELGPSLALF